VIEDYINEKNNVLGPRFQYIARDRATHKRGGATRGKYASTWSGSGEG